MFLRVTDSIALQATAKDLLSGLMNTMQLLADDVPLDATRWNDFELLRAFFDELGSAPLAPQPCPRRVSGRPAPQP